MIGRILAVAIGLLSGLAGAQLPEFGQQYRQRLGGAADELRRVVTRFDDGARAEGLTRTEAVRRLTESSDPVARRQGTAMTETVARLDSLDAQRRAFAEAGPFARLLILARDNDPALARATYLDFEPAWPATSEGLVAGGGSFVLGWGGVLFLLHILRRLSPFRRRTALRAA